MQEVAFNSGVFRTQSVDPAKLALCTGEVVIVEGRRGTWLHRIVAWATGWWWVHSFVISGEDRAVEATWPRVAEFTVSERLAEYTRRGQRFMVLDYPGLTLDQRHAIGVQARSYIGRWYDVFGIVWYAVFRVFNRTAGIKRFFCSRLVTASYRQGANIDLTAGLSQHTLEFYQRAQAMRDGYVTPAEILFFLGFVNDPQTQAHALSAPPDPGVAQVA